MVAVLALKSWAPLYTTRIGLGPRIRLDVVRTALPWTREVVPRSVAPTQKVTLPVGAPPPWPLLSTFAINVTGRPNFAGRGFAVTTTRVA